MRSALKTPMRMAAFRNYHAIAPIQSFQQEQSQQKKNMNYLQFLLPTLALTSYLFVKKQNLAHAAAPSRSDNDRGNKDNKIRFFGTPKQIYRQFATKEDENGFLAMSYAEFF